MKTMIRIQSKDKRDIQLFFDLVSGVATKKSDTTPFKGGGLYTSVFEVDFKRLSKNVTNKNDKNKNVTKRKRVLKQDVSKNPQLIGIAGLYASNGLSYQKIADKMTKEGHKNSRGNKINKEQVQRWLKKYRAEEAKLLKKNR